jgi:hypothetical protein
MKLNYGHLIADIRAIRCRHCREPVADSDATAHSWIHSAGSLDEIDDHDTAITFIVSGHIADDGSCWGCFYNND